MHTGKLEDSHFPTASDSESSILSKTGTSHQGLVGRVDYIN